MELLAGELKSQGIPPLLLFPRSAGKGVQGQDRNRAAAHRLFELQLRAPSFSNRPGETCLRKSGTTAAPVPNLSLSRNGDQVRTPPSRRWFFRTVKEAVQQGLCCRVRVESGP